MDFMVGWSLPPGGRPTHLAAMSNKLSDLLQQFRETGSPVWQHRYDEFVGGLRELGIGAAAPRVGDRSPPFPCPTRLDTIAALTDFSQAGRSC